MIKKAIYNIIKLICIIISIQSQVYAMHKPDEEAECHKILLNLKSIAKEVLYENTSKSLSFEFRPILSNTGKFLIIKYNEDKIKLINLKTSTVIDLGKIKFSNDLTFSANDKFILNSDIYTNTLEIINTETGQKACDIINNVYGFLCKFSQNEKFLSILYNNNNAPSKIINIESGDILYNTTGEICFPEFSPNDKYFLIKHNDNTSELIDTTNGKLVLKLEYMDHNTSPDCVFSRNEGFLFTKQKNGSGELINITEDNKIKKSFEFIESSKFNINDKFLLLKHFYQGKNAKRIIDIKSNKQLLELTKTSECDFMSSDNFLLITHDNNSSQEIFDLKSNISIAKTSPNQYIATVKDVILFTDKNSSLLSIFKLYEESKDSDLFKNNLSKSIRKANQDINETKKSFYDVNINTLE